jgi:hypothetical protein
MFDLVVFGSLLTCFQWITALMPAEGSLSGCAVATGMHTSGIKLESVQSGHMRHVWVSVSLNLCIDSWWDLFKLQVARKCVITFPRHTRSMCPSKTESGSSRMRPLLQLTPLPHLPLSLYASNRDSSPCDVGCMLPVQTDSAAAAAAPLLWPRQ